MKSTTRPTRTRATYRRSDSADTTDAAKARQRLKRNDDRAESIAQERRIGPEPGATVRASVRAGSHGYGRPDRTMVQRAGEEGGGQRNALCLSVRSAFGLVHNDAPRDALSRRLLRPSGGGPGTAQPRAKERGVAPHARGSPVFSFRRRQRVRKLSAVRPCFGPRFMQQPWPRAHSRFPGHALTPTGVMAIRCKQFHLPDL